MCGILFILSHKHVQTEVIESCLLPLLHHRGPDAHHSHKIHNGSMQLHFHGTVLHLRGELTKQPLLSNDGHVFLWNGEIFGGDVKVPENSNDTSILFAELEKLLSGNIEEYEKKFLSLFAGIKGPWAFVFYDAINEKLWYGRDYFGRRSLILRCEDNTLTLSSLGHRAYGNNCNEVTAKQLYCLNLRNINEDELLNSIKIYPLQPCYRNTERMIVDTCIQHRCVVDTEDKNLFDTDSVNQRKNCNSTDSVNHRKNCNSTDSVKQQNISKKKAATANNNMENEKLVKNENGNCNNSCNSGVSHGESHFEVSTQKNNTETCCCCCLSSHVSESANTLPHSSLNTSVRNVNSNDGGYHCPVIGCSNSEQGVEIKDRDNLQCEYSRNNNATTIETIQGMFLDILEEAVRKRVYNLPRSHCITDDGASKVGILFSGGIDSVVLTYLAHRCTPAWESIDLINVAFAQKPKVMQNVKKKYQQKQQSDTDNMDVYNFDVPDRITGRIALKELPKERRWNFVEVDVTLEELQETRRSCITNLVYPLDSVLDDSIGCAIWFAARGVGRCFAFNDNGELEVKEQNYKCPAKVLLTGMGADEQLGGYARHRTKFESCGWVGLENEMKMEVERIAARNLGRDDRCISDHGREARFPFLDENVVSFLQQLPVCVKCDPRLCRGFGEKILLREVAVALGARYASQLPKRAIQFGSKIAKLESNKEKGSDNCRRLENVEIS